MKKSYLLVLNPTTHFERLNFFTLASSTFGEKGNSSDKRISNTHNTNTQPQNPGIPLKPPPKIPPSAQIRAQKREKRKREEARILGEPLHTSSKGEKPLDHSLLSKP